MDNYDQLVLRIAEASKLAKEEIERKVEAKRAKLSGLVSKEGAAQIVAAELGINFEKEKVKISQLMNGMKKANVAGKIVQVYPVREFNKNGREGKVLNLVLADDSSNVKTVLWDTNHIGLFESGSLKEGDVIEISNGSVRNGELHLSSFADIKQSKDKMDNVITEKVFSDKKLSDAKSGANMKTRAFIVQVFDPRYFEVCPECGKKVVDSECAIHGKINPVRRALLNFVLDDGSETTRAVVFGQEINKLGLTDDEIFSLEAFALKKSSLLGEEKLFTGSMRENSLYNTVELTVNNIEDIDVNQLITDLESKS